MSPPPRRNPLDEMSQSDESESQQNLYIVQVHDPIHLGGPFGIFAAPDEDTLLDGFSENVEVLAEFPRRGDLLGTVHHKLRFDAIQKGLPWFSTTMDNILWQLGDVINDAIQAEQVSHFEAIVK